MIKVYRYARMSGCLGVHGIVKVRSMQYVRISTYKLVL